MKLLMIHSTEGIGGTETFMLSIAPWFKKYGCDVDITNTRLNEPMRHCTAEIEVSYQEFPSAGIKSVIGNPAKMIKIIQKNRYDIILGFGFRISMLLRMIRPVLGNTPVMIGLRGLDKWRKWYHIWPDHFTEGKVDLFVCNSFAVAEYRIKRERTPSGKMVVINNGIDINAFDRSRYDGHLRQSFVIPEDNIILTTIANYRYQKGHFFLLDVIEAFKNKLGNTHFVWAGGGHLKEKIQQRINSTGLCDRITMMDYVKDIRPLLSCSDIYLMPSREEGMPRCLMEAMAMGLPSVSTNVGGTHEVVGSAACGLMAEFGDINAFGEQIMKLINSPDLQRSMSATAHDRMVKYFNIDFIAQQYLKLFNLVLAGQRNGESIQKELSV